MKLFIQIPFCFFVSCATLSAAYSQQYNMKYFFNENFGGLPITDSFGISLNDQGQVALQVSTHPTLPINYQQSIYSSSSGYQPIGLVNDLWNYNNYLNNRGVVVGTHDQNGTRSIYRYENGTLEMRDIGFSTPYLMGVNNRVGEHVYGWDIDSDSIFWTDFNTTRVITVDGQRPDWVFGMSDEGIMGLQVGSSFYLHPILSPDFRPIVTPTGYSNPIPDTVRMTDGGLITGRITDLVSSESLFAAWNNDGSFDRILGPGDGLFNVIFNDLGHAIGLDAADQPMYFDATEWKHIQVNDLQGGRFSFIADFNNSGDFVGGMWDVPNARPGYYTGFYASVASVPEPSSAALMSVTIIFTCIYRRRLPDVTVWQSSLAIDKK